MERLIALMNRMKILWSAKGIPTTMSIMNPVGHTSFNAKQADCVFRRRGFAITPSIAMINRMNMTRLVVTAKRPKRPLASQMNLNVSQVCM